MLLDLTVTQKPSSTISVGEGLCKMFRLLHVAIQEGRDLRAGAGTVGIELSAAHAGGDTVVRGPLHRFGTSLKAGTPSADALDARNRKVMPWARVQDASGANRPSAVPVVIPFSMAHATAFS